MARRLATSRSNIARAYDRQARPNADGTIAVIERPATTVVIPHFNRADLLSDAVASVGAQSAKEIEVIVVDDGSSLDQRRRIDKLESNSVRIIDRQGGTKGPSRCRNTGAAASVSDRLIFLDSDDLLAPWCVETRIAAAAQDEDADLWVWPVLLFAEEAGDTAVLWNEMQTVREDALRFIMADPPWHTSSPLWDKSAFDRIGGFNESVMYGDDSDLHMRALVAGQRVRKYPDALPDAFVRRSKRSRITNELSATLIESRRDRLREATRFLQASGGDSRLLAAIEGQYFAEAEFLLFNTRDSRAAIEAVVSDWRIAFKPSAGRRAVVEEYFAVSLSTRDRYYPALRVARRMAMQILPDEFFPKGGAYNEAVADADVMKRLEQSLRTSRLAESR